MLPKPNVAYDPNDPPMSVGSLYPNISQFRLALFQHAIKNEFEYNTEKSDPERLRAYCSKKEEEGCRWRLHASTYRDGVTIKVIGYSCQLLLLVHRFNIYFSTFDIFSCMYHAR